MAIFDLAAVPSGPLANYLAAAHPTLGRTSTPIKVAHLTVTIDCTRRFASGLDWCTAEATKVSLIYS